MMCKNTQEAKCVLHSHCSVFITCQEENVHVYTRTHVCTYSMTQTEVKFSYADQSRISYHILDLTLKFQYKT